MRSKLALKMLFRKRFDEIYLGEESILFKVS